MAARERLVRFAVAYTLLGALLVGVPAFFAPRAFYDHFPFVAMWVDKLPPYNLHLVTDVGELYLGFALLLAWALRRPVLTVPVCAAFALTQVLHTGFHVFHLRGFGPVDAAAQVAALAGQVAAPAFAVAVYRASPQRKASTTS